MNEIFDFFEDLFRKGTVFTVRRVYQYDTFPGYALLAYNDKVDGELRFDEPWMKLYEKQLLQFKKLIEKALMSPTYLLNNKIGVVVDFKIPNHRNGRCGTLLWCHKDWHNGFFFSCSPNTYIKDNLNIEFTYEED